MESPWSPEDEIAFRRIGTDDGDLQEIERSREPVKVVDAAEPFSFDWSRDGRYILYQTLNGEGLCAAWRQRRPTTVGFRVAVLQGPVAILARRPLDRLPHQRCGTVRGVRRVVSRARPPDPRLYQRWRPATLAARREGNLLSLAGRDDDGSGGSAVRTVVDSSSASPTAVPDTAYPASRMAALTFRDGQRFIVITHQTCGGPRRSVLNWTAR